MTPLFIPLRRTWFEAFASGDKRHEWRWHGTRWNAGICVIGRPVTLALGYTRSRLRGVVTSFAVRPASGDAAATYGEGTPCAVIGITLARDQECRFEVRCRDSRGGEHVVGWTRDADGAALVTLAHNDPRGHRHRHRSRRERSNVSGKLLGLDERLDVAGRLTAIRQELGRKQRDNLTALHEDRQGDWSATAPRSDLQNRRPQ